MREIKFRAWDTRLPFKKEGEHILKEMIYFDLFELDETYICESGTYLEGDCKLMQYTGLKDKKGVEIYEGDLITHESRNAKQPHSVLFNLGLAAWCGDYGLKYPLQESELEEVEVIGNIYENPELLKGER